MVHENCRYLIDLSGVQILRPESTGYILHQLKEVIKMRKSGVVQRRDDMIDVMIDAVREEEKYQESVRRGENNNAVRFDYLKGLDISNAVNSRLTTKRHLIVSPMLLIEVL